MWRVVIPELEGEYKHCFFPFLRSLCNVNLIPIIFGSLDFQLGNPNR